MKWSEWQDLNLRPPRPERGALPGCATLRLMAGLITMPLRQAARHEYRNDGAARRLQSPQRRQGRGRRCGRARRPRAWPRGGLVAFPTETVYGLGADATNGRADRPPLCRQGPAGLQPADRPCRRRGRRARASAGSTPRRRAAGRRVLAGTADAGAAEGCRTVRSPISPPPASTASRCACLTIRWRTRSCSGVRPAGRGAVGQPIRARLADHGGACARRSARANRTDRRRRADAGRTGIDHRRLPRRADPAAAGRRSPRDEIERVLGASAGRPRARTRRR